MRKGIGGRGQASRNNCQNHIAAAVAGGGTADAFAWKHVREGSCSADVLWVDEVSMLDIQLLHDLNHVNLRDPHPQWILSGDFQQYLPFFNTFMGADVTKQFEHSTLLHNLAGGFKLVLTECKRSDEALFNDYSSLTVGGNRFGLPLEANVAYFKNKYTEGKATGFLPGTNLAPINLVISHRLRVKINAQCNLAMSALQSEKEHFSLEQYNITADPKQNSPQDMYVWPGLVMVAANTGRHYKNGMEYTIKAFLNGKVVLSGDSDEFQLTKVEFSDHCD